MRVDIDKLEGMRVEAQLPDKLEVQYDWDGDDYKTYTWAWRIPDVVNFVEEHGTTWPEMTQIAAVDGYPAQIDPRAEYIAQLLRDAPALFAEIKEARALRDEAANSEHWPKDMTLAMQWVVTLRHLYRREEFYARRLARANSAMREVVEFAGYLFDARGMHIRRWTGRLKDKVREYRESQAEQKTEYAA